MTGGSLISHKPVKETVTILHRYHFSSALKRMAVIVKVESEAASGPSYWVIAKGAPEVIEDFLAEVPAGYEANYKAFAAQGAR